MSTESQAPVILITGGSRGVGAATARLAAAQGYDVAISYVSNEAAAQAVAADVRAEGRRALAVCADSADPNQVVRLFAAIDGEFGRLDVLVNNAAIIARQSRVEDLTFERMQRIFAVNAIGPMLCAQQAARRMSRLHNGRGGAIINVSSGAARLGSPNEYVDYAASKGALESFTIGFSKEVAREGIRVNGVRPGHIYTEMHASGGEPGRVDRIKDTVPMGRGGQPEEVARAILWLAGAEASYVTGTFVDVTGGK
ncbi:MAG: SDR family oxidoreductase [Achromobacter sp.]|jgi:NAD(P)-dependent dehydrogenase (short-subunit alcohol dehydrogenase family)|uniref:Putative oxidoreductase YgfF n=1 Tax=Achromobacter insuavis TaxID=1287735 RepID=A0A6J5ACC4_9BURK|nr:MULTISPECIES: SDR family oxidoreductase [Achromobacter]MBN9637782.1 SDR family oxidoreductase [Achromobacter sp.]CAB3663576.1 putative oxidoreductase YgfF [Achromobacter insuavis]CUI70473.1 3-oxoacyl-[acyl-carrier-protein] reductase FabG [Achromobacter sp. 2789STDY5608628]CUI83058.1 3-oxoacyl-[acyl-carrier-protein] reductase FabG [Achromobacter sp. 2789STDY5608633]